MRGCKGLGHHLKAWAWARAWARAWAITFLETQKNSLLGAACCLLGAACRPEGFVHHIATLGLLQPFRAFVFTFSCYLNADRRCRAREARPHVQPGCCGGSGRGEGCVALRLCMTLRSQAWKLMPGAISGITKNRLNLGQPKGCTCIELHASGSMPTS